MYRRLKAVAVFSALMVLASCAHRSPFQDEYYFQAMGEDGEIVITADANALRSSSMGILPAEGAAGTLASKAERISVALDPMTEDVYPLPVDQYVMYGAFEGDYGKFPINTALSWSKEFKKEKEDGVRYYRSEELGLEAAVPQNGILLFSSDSYADAYRKTISSRREMIDFDTARLMAEAGAAVYLSSPKTLMDIGFELPQTVLNQIVRCLFLVDESDSVSYISGRFEMKDKSAARSMVTLLKNQLIQKIKRQGGKLDTKALASLFTYEDSIVTIKDMEMDQEMNASIKGIVSKAAGGLL